MFDYAIKSSDYQRSFLEEDPPQETIIIVLIFFTGKGTGLATPIFRQTHWGQPH